MLKYECGVFLQNGVLSAQNNTSSDEWFKCMRRETFRTIPFHQTLFLHQEAWCMIEIHQLS